MIHVRAEVAKNSSSVMENKKKPSKWKAFSYLKILCLRLHNCDYTENSAIYNFYNFPKIVS